MAFYFKKFDASQLPTIKAWHEGQHGEGYAWALLPDHGFMIYGQYGACAAAFARQAEKGVTFVDLIVANPNYHPKDACHYALSVLEDFAKETGSKVLIGWTDYSSMASMAQDQGMHIQKDRQILYKVLK